MSSNFDFSIIISTFNRIKYLEPLLTSIANQSAPATFEVLIIEAGSDKDYLDIVALVSLYSIKIRTFHKPTCTLGESRNFGAENAVGDWCLFSDDDDVWHVDKVRFIFEVNKEFDIMSHGYVTSHYPCQADFVKKKGKGRPLQSNIISIFRNTYGNQYGGGSSLCAKRSVVQLIQFDEIMRGCEDIDWSLRCLFSGMKLGFLPIPLVVYRSHAQRMTKNHIGNAYWEFYLLKKLTIIFFGLAVGIPLKIARLSFRLIFRR